MINEFELVRFIEGNFSGIQILDASQKQLNHFVQLKPRVCLGDVFVIVLINGEPFHFDDIDKSP